MHEETIAFERTADIAGLEASRRTARQRRPVRAAARRQPAAPHRGARRLVPAAQPRTASGNMRARSTAPRLRVASVQDEGAAPGTATRGINFASQDYLSLAVAPGGARRGPGAPCSDAGPHSAGSAVLLGNSRYSLALEAAIGRTAAARARDPVPDRLGRRLRRHHGAGACARLHLVDQLAHASLRQGANAATRNMVLHRHLDTGHVRELLAAIRARDTENAILVVTEGLFSMDSDCPDLPLMQHLCREYNATLLVDVAHDLGAMGPGGARQPGRAGACWARSTW